MADTIAVMRAGAIVEQGAATDIIAAPQHAYTKALLDAARSRVPDRLPEGAAR
jgi:ABC-type dipeptide/oligopeptide/nickel transport system ATPase component